MRIFSHFLFILLSFLFHILLEMRKGKNEDFERDRERKYKEFDVVDQNPVSITYSLLFLSEKHVFFTRSESTKNFPVFTSKKMKEKWFCSLKNRGLLHSFHPPPLTLTLSLNPTTSHHSE